MNVDEVLGAANKLTPTDRSQLADTLLRDLAGEHNYQNELDQAWGNEIARRLDDVRTGKVKTVPAEEAFRMIRNGERPEL